MAAPENKLIPDIQQAKPAQLPRADQAVIMSSEGAAQLPARPSKAELSPNIDKQGVDGGLRNGSQSPVQSEQTKINQAQSSPVQANQLQTTQAQINKEDFPKIELKDNLMQHRIEEVGLLAARSEEMRKEVLNVLFKGQNPDQVTVAAADSLIQLGGYAVLNEQVIGSSLNQEALAKHLLSILQQQRSFDCSAKDLAMLDALEFQLIRVLQQINPNIRNQQQQQQIQEDNVDDDSGAAGPEKVEDDRESSFEGAEEADFDTDTSYSPRSKKGRARARSRDRRSRFKKWLERMMRAFRRQSIGVRGMQGPQASARTQVRERRFVNTVRIFGKVIDNKSKIGIEGVQIVSNTLGIAVTGLDGAFAFENVAQGTNYSLAPVKSGCMFTPLSVNDVALDYREYIFELVHGQN